MSHYRRCYVAGGTYFFTVNLLDRKTRLLVDNVDCLRAAAWWIVAARRIHPT